MTIKAAEYRRRAEEAEVAAKTATDPQTRLAFENIAKSYRELASLRERNADRGN